MDAEKRRRALLEALAEVRRGLPEGANTAAYRRLGLSQRRQAGLELVDEIVASAELLLAARDDAGAPVFRDDARWRLVCALERWGLCPSISDIARRLRISRQAARELVIGAARDGLVELFLCPADRRLIQVDLAPAGRSMLKRTRLAATERVGALFGGIAERELRSVAEVLRVVRRRVSPRNPGRR